MFRIAISAIALAGMGMLALVAPAGGNRPGPQPEAPIESAAPAAATDAQPARTASSWGYPPINPAATVLTAHVDLGPIRGPGGGLAAKGHPSAPVQDGRGVRLPSPTYTTHPVRPAATRLIPIRLGDGFSVEQRAEIIQALAEWNQVLNGFGRLQIVGATATATATAPGTWHVRAVDGEVATYAPGHSLQALAFTEPVRPSGGTVLVYMDRIASVDLTKVMRHEFGHVLGLDHDRAGGVMAARYADITDACIERHTVAALERAWGLASGSLNWCQR